MQKKLKQYFILCLLVIVAGVALLQPVLRLSATEQSNNRMTQIKAAGKLVLGTAADYQPYEFRTFVAGEEQIVGFDISIAQAIADKLGVTLEINDMPFSELLAALQTGSVDIVISGMQATEERKQSVAFSMPYFAEKSMLVTQTTAVDAYENVEDLAGKRVGVLQGSTQEMGANKIRETVPTMEIVAIQNAIDVIQQLKNDTLDAAIMSDVVGSLVFKDDPTLQFVTQIAIPNEEAGASVAVALGNDALLDEINVIIADLLQEGKISQFMQLALAQADTTSATTQGTNPFSFLFSYWPLIVRGASITVIVAFFSVIFGAIGGVLLAFMRLSQRKVWRGIASCYIDFIRGTPLLIQVYLIFYGLPALGVRLPAVIIGIVAMSLNSIAYVGEIVRAGILSVDKGQFEAGESLGMSRTLLMREIILPQAMRNILPALGNEFITIIKESSILSVIAVADLMFVANTIRGNTFQPFTPLIVAAIIYFILTFTLARGLKLLERKWQRDA